MSQGDETRSALDGHNEVVWSAALVPDGVAPDGVARGTAPKPESDRVEDGPAVNGSGHCLSFEEVADEIGGLPEEIREWAESGAVELVDPASARAGRIGVEDFRRIERHQVAVDIQRCFKDPEKFLDTRFERFGDKTPRELLASDDADLVRDLVWQIKSGANS